LDLMRDCVCACFSLQIGSHQFKVSNGDSIFTERLKFCDVNDKVKIALLVRPDWLVYIEAVACVI
jgi:ribosomal protein L21